MTQPLLEPGSKRDPKSGPAYDSITSSDSSFSRRDVSLSHVQPGQAIALPDGSVLPVGGGETTDYRANMATGNSQPPYPTAPVPYPYTSITVTPGPALGGSESCSQRFEGGGGGGGEDSVPFQNAAYAMTS